MSTLVISLSDTAVRLTGTIDCFTEKALVEALDRAAERSPGDVEVDLRGVEFMGAAGYWSLARARRRVAERGGELRLTCAPPFVGHVARRLRLDIGYEESEARTPSEVR